MYMISSSFSYAFNQSCTWKSNCVCYFPWIRI